IRGNPAWWPSQKQMCSLSEVKGKNVNSQLVQVLRQRLERRRQRLMALKTPYFHASLVRFWKYLQGEPMIRGILEELEHSSRPARSQANRILVAHEGVHFRDEQEEVGVAYFVVKECADDLESTQAQMASAPYTPGQESDEMIGFKTAFLGPLCDYIDE